MGTPSNQAAGVKPAGKRPDWAVWITLASLSIVLFAVFFPVFGPQFLARCIKAPRNGCIANLRQIDGAKQQWALDNKKTPEDLAATSDVSTYLKGGVLPLCAEGGTHTVGKVSEHPKCSKGVTHGHTL